ncbi:MAG: hypothetical protein MUE81_20615 [Thermoflexibacter sp.]|jgi:hypothetical protein|nr:hypothetical protein [Thermoflexibacter sp.]
MSSLKVGGVHPLAKKAADVQLSIAKENKEFLDVAVYNTSKSKDYPKAWEKTTLRYGLYVESDVPFLLIELPQESKNYSLIVNGYDINQNDRNSWLKETGATMNIFLINASSNIIESMRTINVSASIASELRKAIQAQLVKYKDASAVSAAANLIASQKNTATMIAKGKMISLLQV